ncbi:MAG TPA: c-type cytochrome biogenesis protein CcmI [Stellaceae bacterium]|nr:c-type cytochrome biogenesis protein CcmI [Stellaceae bacterium]
MSVGLALALIGLTILAIAFLLAPLILRGRRGEARDAYNLAVYRDQLAEIDRDVERGILLPGEAAAAKGEIGRRILALTPAAAPAAAAGSPWIVAAAAIVLLPFAAWMLYWQLGSPGLGDQPFAARATAAAAAQANEEPHVDMADAVRKLAAHLDARPDDLQGWLLLGRSDLALERYKDAAEAYRRAVDLSGRKPEIVGDWGEAQVLAAGGTVTPEAKAAFTAGLADKEAAPRARYYLALAKSQAGDGKAALQDWVDLEADSPADAAWLPALRQRIAEAAKAAGIDPATLKTSAGAPRAPPPTAASGAGNPPAAEIAEAAKAAAKASPEERRAMVEAMVAQLAARLEQQPDDAEGWTRLGRSYLVLNEAQKSADAFAHVVKLKPDDATAKQRYAEALTAADGGDAPPAQALALFREVLAAQPQNAEALWYVGGAEAAAGHAQAAHDLWTKLLAALPADAPIRQQVQERIAGLKLEPGK